MTHPSHPVPAPLASDRRRALLLPDEPVEIHGRVAAIRASSGAAFADVHCLGRLAQVCALRGSAAFDALRGSSLGDWIRASGAWASTRSGDRALFAQEASILALCSLGYPSWREPMSEHTARERPDWARASDPSRMERTLGRMRAVGALRAWAAEAGLMEAITPILAREPSGALAAPFWTQSRSLGPLALRVAPENALIRLLCSGIPALYEIGPSFRNEGVSPRHHPEFLMLEAYRLGWTAMDARDGAIAAAERAWAALGGAALPSWRHFGIAEALSAFGCPPERVDDLPWLRAQLASAGHAPESQDIPLRWQALDELFFPPSYPCSVNGHPESSSPLAAPDPAAPGCCSRFELYMGGMEIGNGYEQLRDEAVQRERFAEQAQRAGAGREAMAADERYLDAMGLGMPALAGFGLGIDRLAALAHGCSIREALPFPLQGG